MEPKGQTRGWGRAVAELADRQHGVVERGQLLALGMSAERVKSWIRLGRLYPLHAGVYAVGSKPLPVLGRPMAAVLACRPDAVLSHRSAAALWGIRGSMGQRIDVTTPRKARGAGPIRRHYSLLPADEITKCEGIPVTTVPRTILDMAASSPQETVEAMLREAEYRRLYDSLSLWDLLERYPRRRGSVAVRRALARVRERPGRIRSPLEERFLPFLDRFDLPRPHFNAWLEVKGERVQVDCFWSSARQIVELDGWEGHGTRAAFLSDRARDRRLRVAGYGVMRVAWAQLDDEPEEIAADLRALLNAPIPA